MSDGRLLLDRRDELLAQIQRGRVPAWAVAELRELVARAIEAWAGRAKAAGRRNAERSAAISAGIRNAAGALPRRTGVAAVVQRRIAAKGPAAYGLKRLPDLRTIRAALEIKKDISEPECSPGGPELRYGAPSRTT